ncbi:adenine deaminase [Candidatus Bathyarchaeota archaeon]|nr:adenine deaminase [Candidatus Bathyarchaeota archaeon]
MSYEDVIRAAQGEIPIDIAVKNVRLVNVLTAEIYNADIGIIGDKISYVGEMKNFQANEVFDANGMYAIPGLIDSHLHIESSMITPPKFAEAVLPRGITTVAIDPHEIANVLGKDGVRLMLETSKSLPLKAFVLIPTCVPAVPKAETAGAEILAQDVAEMLQWERVLGEAELMDYYGVINLEKRMTDIVKVGIKANTVLDGHCMNLDDKGLNAYASVAQANHEYFPTDPQNNYKRDFEQIRKEIRLGMYAKLRKLILLSEIVSQLNGIPNKQNLLFVTDDVMPDDLVHYGHLDDVVRTAIRNGFDPVEAIQSATLYPAKFLRLFDRGAIAPGKLADILLLDELNKFSVNTVFADGRIVAMNGRLLIELPFLGFPKRAKETVKLQRVSTDDFKVRIGKESGLAKVRVIRMQGLLSTFVIKQMEVKDYMLQTELPTVAVFERHGRTGNRTLGFIEGFGLNQGAIASTISHDSHNLVVVGVNATDMAVATNTLIECQGGLVAVKDGKIVAKVELPVAGLMSEEDVEKVASKVRAFRDAEEELGVEDRGTMLAISTLALPVIPNARITDKGLFDVSKQELLPLIVEC